MKKRIMRNGRMFAIGLVLACLVGALFVPMASAAGQGQIMLTVKQVFAETGAPPPSGTFTYRLSPKQVSNPMPAGSGAEGYTFTITGTDDISVGPITFTQADKYTYEISHVTSVQSGYIYDQEVYTLEIYVKSDLAVTVIVYKKDGTKASDITYAHAYDDQQGLLPSDPAVMVDPPVVKTVSGDPAKASTFTFRLTADKPTNPMPAGSKDGVKDLQITGSGKGEFGTWSYTAEGTYYYTVSEVNTGEKGYTYDTTVYTITDAVKAVDGQLVVTRVVTNGANKQVTSLSFINTYTSGGGGNSGNGGNSNGGGKPGSDGPKMGDDTNFSLYIILFGLGGLLVIRTMVYLIVCRKRKKAGG